MPEINGFSVPFVPAGGSQVFKPSTGFPTENKLPSTKFNEIFEKELNNLKFSGHAKTRLESRDLSLSNVEMQKLESAVSKAEKKGANDLLVLMDEKAFIINVPNNTVVTVMDKNKLQENVITNIDSAVFA